MAEDVWTALVKGVLAFGQSRASDLVQDSFQDAGGLVQKLGAGVNDQNTKTALQTLEDDIKNLTAEGQAVVDACKADFKSANDALTACGADLSANPFTLAAAGTRRDRYCGRADRLRLRVGEGCRKGLAQGRSPIQSVRLRRDCGNRRAVQGGVCESRSGNRPDAGRNRERIAGRGRRHDRSWAMR